MKKEEIIVPRDKSPLDILAEMGERTKSAWIFMHQNAIKKLISIADSHREHPVHGFIEFYWKATKKYLQTSLITEYKPKNIWVRVISIEANNIAFHEFSKDPEEIIFLKMEK